MKAVGDEAGLSRSSSSYCSSAMEEAVGAGLPLWCLLRLRLQSPLPLCGKEGRLWNNHRQH